jgi:type 1 glutamine amidotransferase
MTEAASGAVVSCLHPEETSMNTLQWMVAVVALTATVAEAAKPLEVLYVTGGCCHDYDGQKQVIAKGLAARARVNVTVVHEGGTSTDHKVSIYSKPEWAKGYDVVFHNECFAKVKDLDFVKGIVAEHRRGVPAVMMHCSMHCYRTGTEDWFELCGITSPGHGPHYEYTAHLIADHPILAGLPREWKLPKEELYYCDKLFPTATPLAEAMSRERNANQTVAWTNDYHGTRVFGTTIGHYTDTVKLPEFLDLVTRGTLWAAGKLDDDGTPADGLELTPGEQAAAADWAAGVTLPAEEQARAVRLFNGRDFTGWEGHVDPYWSIEGAEIVGRNTVENAPNVSTYLLTTKPYRDFRLLFEGRLVTSEMHSGVAIWGKKFEKDGEASSYQGHLVMFPSGWGLWDLYRRNGISGDQEGRAKKAGRQHDWNQMEILAIGSRIRFAVNGQEVLDWTDPQPELCGAGPIGLQLHSNKVPQEVRFRGLVLVENPQDVLVTAAPTPAK